MTGFTGVEWASRGADRLAADLHHGAGVSPLVEAGLAWGDAAIECAALGGELRSVIGRLGDAWEATAGWPVQSHAQELIEWLHDAGEFAAVMSRTLQGQSAATTVAMLAMPNPIEIAATAALRDSMTVVGSAIGGALLGAGAAVDRDVSDQHHRAARVMQAYESASAALAVAQPIAPPPACLVVPAGRPDMSSTAPVHEATSGVSTNPVVPALMLSVPRTAYAAATPAVTSSAGPSSAEIRPSSREIAESSVPMAPVSAAGATGDRGAPVPRITATASEPSASVDRDLALWVESVAAPAMWESTDPPQEPLLRLPQPAERGAP